VYQSDDGSVDGNSFVEFDDREKEKTFIYVDMLPGIRPAVILEDSGSAADWEIYAVTDTDRVCDSALSSGSTSGSGEPELVFEDLFSASKMAIKITSGTLAFAEVVCK
jgi:hypothetical protein